MSASSLLPDSVPTLSTSLLARVQAMQPAAWSRLSRLFGPIAYGWARQAGLQPHDAADVVQNVFHSVATNISNFQRDNAAASFRGWLWTITRSKIHDHFRAVKKRAAATGGTTAMLRLNELPESPPPSSCDDELANRNRLRRRALELIRTEFDTATWQAFWRFGVEGEPANDVAKDLGVTPWAVYKAKSRVLKRLRDELQGLEE